jgi:hypothetical protein
MPAFGDTAANMRLELINSIAEQANPNLRHRYMLEFPSTNFQ